MDPPRTSAGPGAEAAVPRPDIFYYPPAAPAPGGMGGSRRASSGDSDSSQNEVTKMIRAPEPTTQAWTTPLSSVAPTTTSSAPASRNLGHQRVRRVRARRPGRRRAGLLAGAAGRPNSPGTGGTTDA